MGMLMHHTWLKQQEDKQPVKKAETPVEPKTEPVKQAEEPQDRKPGRRKATK